VLNGGEVPLGKLQDVDVFPDACSMAGWPVTSKNYALSTQPHGNLAEGDDVGNAVWSSPFLPLGCALIALKQAELHVLSCQVRQLDHNRAVGLGCLVICE
jgi:hypothetical protein